MSKLPPLPPKFKGTPSVSPLGNAGGQASGPTAAVASHTTPQASSTIRFESERIYITREWYLQVDNDGYIDGIWFEGAFGCVVPMYHVEMNADGSDRLALKIPRLLADTVRENEFIRHIVQTEARLVTAANRGTTHRSGLVPTQEIAYDVLRGRRAFPDAEDPALAAQDGCVLLFSFRKGRPPRVVSVKLDEKSDLVVFPSGVGELASFITPAVWAEMRDPNEAHDQARGSLQRGFREPYFFEFTEKTGSRVTYGPMCWTMSVDREPAVWYSALPSIIYKWAPGTLQRAVSQRGHVDWRLVDHYDLHIQISRGIATLHGKGLIHGDLRPANIMLMGVHGSAERPEEYAVGDYGSFSTDRSRNGPTPAASGHTMTGAGISRQRTSMFYAPERRHGYERENADVAIVINYGSNTPYYLICLGWGASLFAPGTTMMREDLQTRLEGEWKELLARQMATEDAGKHERTRDGDRLRLRDYVFEVRASKAIPEMSLFLVDKRYAQVLHERVAVYSRDDEVLRNGAVITLPMYTEIHQWSAATDLYGVGTLALYTLFMSALQRDSSEFDESVNSKFESTVAELIGRLGSVPDAVEFWADLDLFWSTVEQLTMPRQGDAGKKYTGLHNEVVPGGTTNMITFAVKTTNNLLRIKNMKHLLSCFRKDLVTPRDGRASVVSDVTQTGELQYNLAHFLFFVHFLLSCIHRRDTYEAYDRIGSSARCDRILCADRCEQPGPAAELALSRLTTLQERVNSPTYDGFLAFHGSLDFEYRAESEYQLNRRCTQAENKGMALEQALENQKSAVLNALSDLTNLASNFARRRFRFIGIGEFLLTLKRGIEQGVRATEIRVRTLIAGAPPQDGSGG